MSRSRRSTAIAPPALTLRSAGIDPIGDSGRNYFTQRAASRRQADVSQLPRSQFMPQLLRQFDMRDEVRLDELPSGIGLGSRVVLRSRADGERAADGRSQRGMP